MPSRVKVPLIIGETGDRNKQSFCKKVGLLQKRSILGPQKSLAISSKFLIIFHLLISFCRSKLYNSKEPTLMFWGAFLGACQFAYRTTATWHPYSDPLIKIQIIAPYHYHHIISSSLYFCHRNQYEIWSVERGFLLSICAKSEQY